MFMTDHGQETYSLTKNTWKIVSQTIKVVRGANVPQVESDRYFYLIAPDINGAFTRNVYEINEHGTNVLLSNFVPNEMKPVDNVMVIESVPQHCKDLL